MADVVIEAAGEISAINLAVELAEVQGFILFFGVPRTDAKPTIPFEYDRFFKKNLLAPDRGRRHDGGQPVVDSAGAAVDRRRHRRPGAHAHAPLPLRAHAGGV